MLQTILTTDAANRLRHGHSFVYREDILALEGQAEPGEPAYLLAEDGTALGLGDVDLEAQVAVRRIGLPEERVEGIIPRQLRRALERRADLVSDPRYCRVVNQDGDGLPGLVIDRYDGHFALQTLTRPMDARADELARALGEVTDARSVILRNDTWRRAEGGLPVARRHVLAGMPPRWTRIQELGARLTVDLHSGVETGYRYELRDVRRWVAMLSNNARVLELTCQVGGKLVQAGRGGARQIIAFDPDPDAVELTRENIEINGLLGKAHVELGSPLEGLSQAHAHFDLVLLDLSHSSTTEESVTLLRGAIRSTRRGGKLLVSAGRNGNDTPTLEALLEQATTEESRAAFKLLRLSSPPDFPQVLGAKETFCALCLELG